VSLRQDGSLEIVPVTDPALATVGAVRSALETEGSIGVICADAAAPALAAALQAAGLVQAPTVDSEGDDGRVALLPASLAKGLEFDHVIVVEPDEIVRAEPRGLARLYVALTRAVSRLTVLHTTPFPLP
jgi:DNA helicase IV